MRMKFLAVLTVLSLCSGTVFAGNLTYGDGRGGWKSTMCTRPERPANLPTNAEAAASDLNARIESYNAYAGQTQAYMDCVSKEVEHDAQSAQYVLTESSKKLIQAAQDDLATIQNQLKIKRKQ
jgi:hypothetical protein